MYYRLKKLALAIFVLFVCSTVFSQNYYKDSAMNKKHKLARNNVLDEGFEYAIDKYAMLLSTEDNTIVRAEYAYTLALAKCYDGAIINLDKVFVSGKADNTTLFYTAQVLKLMEYDKIADVFWDTSVIVPPDWIRDKYQSFVNKYKYPGTINTDNIGAALQHANNLVAQKLYIQSIVLYQELIETYPDEYLPYIGFSALWESLGYKELAIEYMQNGINVMGDNKSQYDVDDVYENHLNTLKNNQTQGDKMFQPNNIKKLGVEQQPPQKSDQEILFKKRRFETFSLSYVNNSLSFNAKYGVYWKDNSSFSLNLGWISSGNTSIYTASMYACATSGIISFGVSLNGQLMGTEFDGGGGLIVGLSLHLFGNKASIDLADGLYYMIKAKDFGGSLSIGYTIYF